MNTVVYLPNASTSRRKLIAVAAVLCHSIFAEFTEAVLNLFCTDCGKPLSRTGLLLIRLIGDDYLVCQASALATSLTPLPPPMASSSISPAEDATMFMSLAAAVDLI